MHKKVVIIPTYNEINNIEPMARRVLALAGQYHLLVIDDGSPDGTAAVVKKLQDEFADRLHLIERQGKQGLGTAYIAGFKWALSNGYDFVFEMDADFSHCPDDLERLYSACQNGADVAIGSRYINGVNVVNWPMKRVLMSYFASAYVRFITRMKVMDTTAGFKCYKAEVLKAFDLDSIRFKGYAFQIEMKFTAWKMGFNVVEVPIVFTERREGVSKMSGGIFNEAFWGVLSMKVKSLFKKYDKEPFSKGSN
ncbi:MAG: polyprenol monophosphomannose synthase [Bacteroidales bacterium]|nr:polyprenol monophosphomannose synthase [Tenuifilaceae bacterium]